MSNTVRVTRLDEAAIAAVADFKRIKAEIRRLDDLKAAAEAVILDALNGKQIGIDGQGTRVVRVSHRSRAGVDRKALETAYPDIYAETMTVTEYDVLMTP